MFGEGMETMSRSFHEANVSPRIFPPKEHPKRLTGSMPEMIILPFITSVDSFTRECNLNIFLVRNKIALLMSIHNKRKLRC